jgi:hypothetical protein
MTGAGRLFLSDLTPSRKLGPHSHFFWGLFVQQFEAESEAWIAEDLELGLQHRQQRLVWVDFDRHGVELTGVAFKFRRKRAELFANLVFDAKFGFRSSSHGERVSPERGRA